MGVGFVSAVAGSVACVSCSGDVDFWLVVKCLDSSDRNQLADEMRLGPADDVGQRHQLAVGNFLKIGAKLSRKIDREGMKIERTR